MFYVDVLEALFIRSIFCIKIVKHWSQDWLIAAGANPGFCSMKRLGVRFPQQFSGTQLYSWVERGTVRVECLAQEHNTVSLARARTRTTCSGNERTDHIRLLRLLHNRYIFIFFFRTPLFLYPFKFLSKVRAKLIFAKSFT